MIRLRDAATLALTKLHTRKIRLGVTIVISGLLFTVLAGASIVARGTFASLESFGQEGFGQRYIVSGYPYQSYDYSFNQTVIDRAMQLHKERVAKKTAEAKRLKLPFDGASETPPVQDIEGPGGKQKILDTNSPSAQQAIKEYLAAQKQPDISALKDIAAPYGATNYYTSTQMPYMGAGSLQVLKEGQEKFDQGSGNMYSAPRGLDSFSQMWQTMSSGLLEPFLIPGQTLEKTTDGAVPVVVPVSAAEELLKLQALPASATASEKLDRLKQIRSQAADIRFEVCIRNSTSSGLIGQALSAQAEIEANKNDKDYVKPTFMYGLPTEACGASPVVRDLRTADQKAQAARQEEFDRIFGKLPPEQHKVAFRVVGVAPDIDMGGASTVAQIVRGLVMSSLGTGWISPSEYIEADPVLKNVFDAPPGMSSLPMVYAEFDNATGARDFLEKAGCVVDFGKYDPTTGQDPYQPCRDEGKYFDLSSYGSNSLGLESAKRGFGKIFRYAALGVALVATIIMMGTVGRMIADSRRETAVFRAIGAKKLDIASVYVLYTLLLSALVCLFAVSAGMLIASFLHAKFAQDLTVEALVAYNAQNLGRSFKLYSFYWPDMLQLVGLAVAGGVVSSLLPLLRNLRRNPIRDMRDDT